MDYDIEKEKKVSFSLFIMAVLIIVLSALLKILALAPFAMIIPAFISLIRGRVYERGKMTIGLLLYFRSAILIISGLLLLAVILVKNISF